MSIKDQTLSEAAVTHDQSRGFSLIEVLVSLLILSIGLLGMAGVQTRGVTTNYSALQRSQATLNAYDIVERMRANRQTARLSSWPYQIDFGDTADGGLPTLVKQDIDGWLDSVDDLPNGQGSITMTNLGGGRIQVTIQVRWDEKGDAQLISVETIL